MIHHGLVPSSELKWRSDEWQMIDNREAFQSGERMPREYTPSTYLHQQSRLTFLEKLAVWAIKLILKDLCLKSEAKYELPDILEAVKTLGLVWATKGVDGSSVEKNNPKNNPGQF